jgi:hypothetical protein
VVGDAVAVCRGKADGGELVAATVMKLAASDDDTKIRYVGGGREGSEWELARGVVGKQNVEWRGDVFKQLHAPSARRFAACTPNRGRRSVSIGVEPVVGWRCTS